MAPWNKDPGPLAKNIKEGDLLKKKVDPLVKESNKVIGNKKLKDKEAKLEQLYSNCIDTKKLVLAQYDKTEQLKEEEEPNKIKDYEKKKTQELNRMSTMKTLLEETMAKLLPDTTEEEFSKKKDDESKTEDKEDTEEKEKDEKEEEEKAEGKEKAKQKKNGKVEEVEEEEDEDEDEEDEEDEEEEDEEDEVEEEEEDEEEEDEEEEEETVPKKAKFETPAPAARKIKAKDEEEEEEEEDEDEEDEEEEEEDEEEEDEEEEEEEEKPKAKPVPQKRQAKHEEEDEDEEEEEEDEEEEVDEEEEDEEEEVEEEDEKEKKKKDKKKTDGSKSKKDAKGKGKKKKEEKKEKEEEMDVTQQSTHRFVAVDDYEGEEDGDLGFAKGTILTIVETREDGWWVAENEEGDKGLVPSTYLQKYNPYKDVQQDDDEEDEEEEEEEDEDEETSAVKKKKRSRKLWGSIKKALEETNVSDVLHAMGAVPSGFRLSTLCRKFNENDSYRLSNYLTPNLSQSNLMYSDLFFEPSTNKIRPRSTRIERVITLVSCQQIPPPGAGVEVEGRHVRMCLFDGQQILSNIHSVNVSSVDKSQRSWAFSTRLTDAMDPFTHGEVFVRTNNTANNIGLLFELCISYSRVSTNEKGEFSCGWVHLPLLDLNGMVTNNKSFDLYVNGGTPYEKGIEVDPTISRRRQSATSNALASLISGNKQPRLIVKLNIPKQQHKEFMDTLPDTMMGSTAMLPLYSMYRNCLADTLLRDRLDLDSTELIHSPLFKSFPSNADVPDLMKVLRTTWLDKLREVRRAEKPSFFTGLNLMRDEEYMKEVFRQIYLESVYPLRHLAIMPSYRMGDVDNDKIRQESILKYNETKRSNKSPLAALLSPDLVYEPFLMEEVAYSIINTNCLNKPVVVS